MLTKSMVVELLRPELVELLKSGSGEITLCHYSDSESSIDVRFNTSQWVLVYDIDFNGYQIMAQLSVSICKTLPVKPFNSDKCVADLADPMCFKLIAAYINADWLARHKLNESIFTGD